MQKLKKIGVSGVNTALLSIIVSVGGIGMKEIYKELRQTHDDVLLLKAEQTIQDNRIHSVELSISRHDAEIQRLKARKL